MNEDKLNMAIRQYLKKVGVSSQSVPTLNINHQIDDAIPLE